MPQPNKSSSTSRLRLGTRYAGSVVTAVVCLITLMPVSAAPKDDSTPLLRAEKTLRDIGGKAKDTASDITSYALSLIGVDYRFGGNTPDQGLDCSGLIRYVFQQATGLSLPRSAREQARVGESVGRDSLQPGDLVFFNTRRFQFSHVGLYIGDNRFIHAPSRGGAVQVVRLDDAYWQKAFNGARRIVGSIPDIGALVSTANAAVPKLSAPFLVPVVAPNAEALAPTPSAADAATKF